MRARAAASGARDKTSSTGQRKVRPASGGSVTGGPIAGGDNRIIAVSSDRRAAPSRVLAAILIGISIAAIFGSGPTLRWTETLPDGRLAATLHDAAAKWNEALSPLGASRPHDWLRATLRAFEALHF